MSRVFALLFAFAALQGMAADDDPKFPTLTVNSEKIPASTIELLYKRTLANYQRFYKDPLTGDGKQRLASQARQQAVQQAVVRQYVDASKIVATPEAIGDEVQVMKEQLEGAGMKFEDFLKDRNQSAEDFSKEIAPMAAVLQSCSGMLNQEKLKADFEKAKSQIPLRRCSHILFMHSKSPQTTQKARSPEDAKKLAEDALALVRGGADFADIAQDKSDCPSKAQGGDLGWFLAKAMVKPFSDAAFALTKVGDISPVVETEFGYHIIKLTGLRTEEDAYKVFVRRSTEAKANELIGKLMREAKVSAQE